MKAFVDMPSYDLLPPTSKTSFGGCNVITLISPYWFKIRLNGNNSCCTVNKFNFIDNRREFNSYLQNEEFIKTQFEYYCSTVNNV